MSGAHNQNKRVSDLIIEAQSLSWKTAHPVIAQLILRKILGTNSSGSIDIYELKDFAISLIENLRTISDHSNEEVLKLLHNLFILRDEENSGSENEEATADFSSGVYNKKLFSKFINDLDNNNNRIEVFNALTSAFPDENAHFWAHFSRLHSVNKSFEKSLEIIDRSLGIDDNFIFYHIKGMCYRTELYRLIDEHFGDKGGAERHNEAMKIYFHEARDIFKQVRIAAPKKVHGYMAYIQMVIRTIEFQYSISSLKEAKKDYTKFITVNKWCRDILVEANEIISDYNNNNQEFINPEIRKKQIQLLKYFGKKETMINAWNSLIGNYDYDQNLVRRQLSYALLAKNEFNWEQANGADLKRIIGHIEENLKNKGEVRDLRLWFEASRRVNNNIEELIKKVERWEFQQPSLDTAYLLMCLFGVQAIKGVKSGVDNYEKFQKEVASRNKAIYSKVFCIEWVGGSSNGTAMLFNHRQLGRWERDKQFFDVFPSKLLKMKGSVVKYISRNQGFIEIEGVGIEVMYQPAKFDHLSDDAQKRTGVEFYLGFNYDGARAFEVKNL